MRYVRLGRTGVEVSELCFGTMSFGGDADEQTSAKLFARCRDAGINFFDCANIYNGGRSEEILGRLMAGGRDELVITSKVNFPTGQGPNARGLSRRSIMLEAERSLRRMGTDRIDVYFCHHFDPNVELEQVLRAFDDLIRQGKVLYMGVSNWTAWQTARALGLAERLGTHRPQVLQPMYNLAKRACEIEILPLAQAEGLGVMPYSPLGGGLLSGKFTPSRKPEKARLTTNEMYAARYGWEGNYEIAEAFATYADRTGVHPVTLAVAWVKAHPAVTCPILGARNVEQLAPSLAAAEVDLSDEQVAEIARLTPPVPVATDRDEERPEIGKGA